jgi:CheY-like chemotaxis protein
VILVKEAIKMLRSSIPTTIAIEQNLQRDCGLINADPTQIQQILLNLCTNAFHAMEDKGGVLSIALQKVSLTETELSDFHSMEAGNYVKLTVADTGTGISPEILEKIFDPYFTTKETGKGTGMGLAIIHGIVTGCGGYVYVDSQPGTGTSFQVYLPVWSEEYMPDPNEVESTPQGIEHILFVDDEDLLAEMGRTMLERLGYRVTVQTGSQEAYSLFEEQPDAFDVLITDQTMPEMTGFELAGKVLQIRPDFPIILCTGYSSQVTKEKALAAGIKGFALKPLAKHDIAVLIRNVLE